MPLLYTDPHPCKGHILCYATTHFATVLSILYVYICVYIYIYKVIELITTCQIIY